MVGGEAGLWVCHASLAITKVVLGKSDNYKMNHWKNLSYG
jgi:hypothetical protein